MMLSGYPHDDHPRESRDIHRGRRQLLAEIDDVRLGSGLEALEIV